MCLRRIALQAIRGWIARDLSKKQVEAELGYNLSLALLGIAVPEASVRIKEKLLGYQAILVVKSM
jgi:hypothetical protein